MTYALISITLQWLFSSCKQKTHYFKHPENKLYEFCWNISIVWIRTLSVDSMVKWPVLHFCILEILLVQADDREDCTVAVKEQIWTPSTGFKDGVNNRLTFILKKSQQDKNKKHQAEGNNTVFLWNYLQADDWIKSHRFW